MTERGSGRWCLLLAAAGVGGAALFAGCGDDDAAAPGAAGVAAGAAGDAGSAGAAGAPGGGGGGGGGGAVDCDALMNGGGPPAGGGDPAGLFQCAEASCATACADLLGARPGGGPPGAGGGGAAGAGGASPGALVYEQRSCATCHGAFGEGASGPNVTPSTTAGIGTWTDAQIAAAIRDGVAADGASLCASMPRWDAAQLDDAGLAELTSFLRGLAPVDVPNAGTLCGDGAGAAGGPGGPGGMGPPPASDACLACLDPSCPEIATLLRCFAGAP